MDKQAFKQRMQNLKSYRENNPGKGYWDWKVQAYQNGGRHALGVGQAFASLADMLFNKERRTPAIAAAAYYTIHQTQNDPVLAPVEAPLVEPIADAIKSVDETPYDPGEVFLLSPENQKKQMTKNPKGMQSIKKASEQFKSMRSYTKWFNTIPLLGVGAVGANKYFTSNENRD